MATFSAVTRQHILSAIAEYDARGADDFRGVYGFTDLGGDLFEHEGRSYDTAAVLGVAHRYATGRLATADELHGGWDAAAALLRRRGFDIPEPEPAYAPAPVRATRSRSASPRVPGAPRAPRAAAAPAVPKPVKREDLPPALCPTCSMVLPATGVCDECG